MDPATMQLVASVAGDVLGNAQGGTPSGGMGEQLNAPISQRSGPAYSGNTGAMTVIGGGSGGAPWGWIVGGVVVGLVIASMRKGRR